MSTGGDRAPVLLDRPVDEVLRVRLNRPGRRNAIDAATIAALTDALRAPDARAVVIGSAAPAMFCSGADLDVGDDERAAVSDALYALYETIVRLPVPVVAAIGGDAVGGGAQLAVAADLRVAAPVARLRFPGAGHGLAVGAWALPSLVGRGRAMDLCLTMRWVLADEALRIGLVDRVADDAPAAAVALAGSLAGLRGDAVARIKQAVLPAPAELDPLGAERAGNRAAWSGSIAGLERLR